MDLYQQHVWGFDRPHSLKTTGATSMASRPNTARHAVHVTPSGWGTPVLFVFDEPGAANNVASQINERSDASAEVLGAVQELPMIVTDAGSAVEARDNMRRDFERLMPDRRLLAIVDVTDVEDGLSLYFKGLALWAFVARPKEVLAPTAPAAEKEA